jgi:hypothetical protein
LLEKGVQEHGNSFAKIALSIEGRTAKQCGNTWQHHPANKVRTACILNISYIRVLTSLSTCPQNKGGEKKAAKAPSAAYSGRKRAADTRADLKASAALNFHEDSSSSGAFIYCIFLYAHYLLSLY